MTSLREKKKEVKRQRILRSAMQLFSQKGFENTSVEDITKKAKVAKGTFYNFFEKKEDVLLYFLDKEIYRSRETIKRFLDNRKNLFEKLDLLIFTYFKYIFRNKNLARVLMKERVGKTGPQGTNSELELIKSISQLIEEAEISGEIPSSVDSLFLAEAIFGIYTSYCIYWFKGVIKSKRECLRRIRDTVRLLFNGAGPGVKEA